MPETSSDVNAQLNALDTRDITLPRRLWSWLVTKANDNNTSVDEIVARLIDTYRHPEVATRELGEANTMIHEQEEQSRSATQPASETTESTRPEPPASEKSESATDEASATSEKDTVADTTRPQGAPPPSANAEANFDADATPEERGEREHKGQGVEAEKEAKKETSAAERLRKASDRLRHLMNESKSKDDTSEQSKKKTDSKAGARIRELLSKNDKLRTLEPPETASRKSPEEGVSMFDVAAKNEGNRTTDKS
ncbi:MAG: hypothetical protein PPP56_04500 [Longimonas sp.]|uniref:hypothetical protein n=1 Tax=Longimonas sp. TaxID=2039626 RepID=UPI00335FB401